MKKPIAICKNLHESHIHKMDRQTLIKLRNICLDAKAIYKSQKKTAIKRK